MTEQIDYDPNTVLEALNNKADRDLNNVTDGTYQVLTTKNITNCITKIPQDIKLELNDGTLTLKAGSKVYVPNGVGVFDAVTISSDLSTTGYHDGQIMIFAQCSSLSSTSINGITEALVYNAKSGTSPETSVYYNTSLNMIYRYTSSSTYDLRFALPIAICTRTSSKITSIDQIFNGFGYIGSTIFALPGIEGLIPDGRNNDGSLNNIKFITEKVLIYNNSVLRLNANIALADKNINPQNIFIYDEKNNVNLSGGTRAIKFANVGNFAADSTGLITSLTPKFTFNAIDRNEIDNIIDTRINYRFQVVSELPPVQDPNTFYFIPEE